jgi:hypothetical protein
MCTPAQSILACARCSTRWGLVLRLHLLHRYTYYYYYYYYCCYYYYHHHHYHNTTTLVFTIAKLGSELDLQPPCVDLPGGLLSQCGW